MFATTFEDVMAGRPASFSWRELIARKAPEPSELRRIIEIKPVLDFTALEPGSAATKAIRQAVADLKLDTEYLARVRLTGPISIQDEEFGTLKENADLNAAISLAFLLGILWLALRSPRIILAVFISIFVGLSITAALGLMMVGTLNPISIAFAVLFVGIGVDFGIQFSVRYRTERYEINNLRVALSNAAKHVGVRSRSLRRQRRPVFWRSCRPTTRACPSSPDRRPRHDCRVPDQRHTTAGLAAGIQPGGRKGTARLCVARPG
jgi:hypothetical protein